MHLFFRKWALLKMFLKSHLYFLVCELLMYVLCLLSLGILVIFLLRCRSMAFELHPVDFANVLFGLSVADVGVNGDYHFSNTCPRARHCAKHFTCLMVRYKDPVVPTPAGLRLPPEQSTLLIFLYSSPQGSRRKRWSGWATATDGAALLLHLC